MHEADPYLHFTRPLEQLELRYMISGSVAAIYYGEPRMTNDVDLILFLRGQDVDSLVAAFPASEFYCPPSEVIEYERIRESRGHFNLIHLESGFRADVYLSGRDELHAWGIRNLVRASIGDESVSFAPPEYVIIRKLQFLREGGSGKHLRDIHRMLVGLGSDWDRTTLTTMIRDLQLESEWARVSEFAE
jgi:hypothetical protein